MDRDRFVRTRPRNRPCADGPADASRHGSDHDVTQAALQRRWSTVLVAWQSESWYATP